MDTEPARAGNARRRRFRVLVVAVSVLGAIVGSVLLATRGSEDEATTRGVTAILRVPRHPGWLAASRDALWVALADAKPPARDRPLLRLDLASGAIQQSVLVGGQASYVTRVGNAVVASVQHVGDDGLGPSRLIALDWRSGRLLVRRGFEGPVGPLAGNGEDLWALELRPVALLRLDARTLAPAAAPLRLGERHADGLAMGAGYVWVTASDAGDVLRVDPDTRTVKRFHTGGAPVGVVVAGGSVWVADRERGEVDRLASDTFRPVGEPLDVGSAPTWMGAAGRYVFVGDAEAGIVRRIDVRTGQEAGPPIRVADPARGARPFAVAPADSSVWVSSFASDTLTRISATSARSAPRPVTATSATGGAEAVRPLPRGGEVVARIGIPPGSGAFTVGEGAVWSMSDDVSKLLRIDPKRNAVVARIEVETSDDAAAGAGGVWVSHPLSNTVSRIDPQTNSVAATIHAGPQPAGVAVSPGAVWVANSGDPSVSRIDPSTNRIVATVGVGPHRACCAEHMGLTTGGGAVWVAVPNANMVVRVDPATNRVTGRTRLPFPPCGFLDAGRAAVWVAAASCGEVVGRIDARTNRLTATARGEPHPVGVGLGFGSLWVAVLDLKTVDRVDPRTGLVVARLPIAGIPVRLAVGFGSVWLRDDTGRVLRIRPDGSAQGSP